MTLYETSWIYDTVALLHSLVPLIPYLLSYTYCITMCIMYSGFMKLYDFILDEVWDRGRDIYRA
ncbi:hypothetical protein HYDPIDRAFT_104665 [Hydnomerulius pinastri MD-312]|nr:hypothetical protein HYDPIDRAFT_104665 [Hydnomerulius pinastri MD-312]